MTNLNILKSFDAAIKDLEKRQKEFEKRLEFLEMQTAENISNLDKIYKGLERMEKRLDRMELWSFQCHHAQKCEEGLDVKSVRLPHFEHEDRNERR